MRADDLTLEPLVRLVGRELQRVQGELLLGDGERGRGRLEVCEEELEQRQVTELGRVTSWAAEPRPKRPGGPPE